MKAFSILGVSIAVVLGAVWYVPATVWGYKISSAVNAATAEGATDEEQMAGFEAINNLMKGPAPIAWLRNKGELRDLYRLDELTRARSVSVNLSDSFANLLAPGEAAPESVYADLYAAARAPARIAQICAEVLQTIGSSCKIYISEGRVRDDNAYLYGSLAYIPSYDMGDPSTVDNGVILGAYVRLFDIEDGLPFTAETRVLALKQALAVCGALRATYGNCVIGGVDLNGGDAQLTATASISIYADQSKVNKDAVVLAAQTAADLLPAIR